MSEHEEFEKWLAEQHETRKAERRQCIERIESEFAQSAWQACAERKEQQLAELAAQNAQLREALSPFSKLLQEHNRRGKDNQPIFGINGATILLGDLRKAVKALSLPQPEALREIEAREQQLEQLLYAVAQKFPNETRFETALRYIRNAEKPTTSMAAAKREQTT